MHMPFTSYMDGGLMHPAFGALSGMTGAGAVVMLIIIGLLALWSIVWKGIALWHAARNGQTWWFVVFLIVNFLGVPEIIYLLFFRADKKAWVVPVQPVAAVESKV